MNPMMRRSTKIFIAVQRTEVGGEVEQSTTTTVAPGMTVKILKNTNL